MDKLFNRIVNFAVLIASIALITHICLYEYRARGQSKKPVYPNGSVIADTADLGFKFAPRTLVLITSSNIEPVPFLPGEHAIL